MWQLPMRARSATEWAVGVVRYESGLAAHISSRPAPESMACLHALASRPEPDHPVRRHGNRPVLSGLWLTLPPRLTPARSKLSPQPPDAPAVERQPAALEAAAGRRGASRRWAVRAREGSPSTRSARGTAGAVPGSRRQPAHRRRRLAIGRTFAVTGSVTHVCMVASAPPVRPLPATYQIRMTNASQTGSPGRSRRS
jgi:hypothetical protein